MKLLAAIVLAGFATYSHAQTPFLPEEEFLGAASSVRSAASEAAPRIAQNYQLRWDAGRRRYLCEDGTGGVGYNPVSVSELVRLKEGQCAALAHADLRGIRFKDGGPDLQGADLSGADLSGANLLGADLFAARLGGATGTRLYCGACDLSLADLGEARLSQANLDPTVITSLHNVFPA